MATSELMKDEDPVRLYKGKSFPTHDAFLQFLERYGKSRRQIFTYESGVLVENARRIKRFLDPNITYYSAKYSCKYSTKHKSQSTGQRSSRY